MESGNEAREREGSIIWISTILRSLSSVFFFVFCMLEKRLLFSTCKKTKQTKHRAVEPGINDAIVPHSHIRDRQPQTIDFGPLGQISMTLPGGGGGGGGLGELGGICSSKKQSDQSGIMIVQ